MPVLRGLFEQEIHGSVQVGNLLFGLDQLLHCLGDFHLAPLVVLENACPVLYR